MFTLKSSAFENNGLMPEKYTIDGGKVSPPLEWENPPADTKSFALVVLDLDVPEQLGGFFLHWAVYDIPGQVREFQEGQNPPGSSHLPNTYAHWRMPDFANYGPPWPPDSAHRYEFTLYALDIASLSLSPNTTYQAFIGAIRAFTIESATLIGVYGPAKTPMPTGE